MNRVLKAGEYIVLVQDNVLYRVVKRNSVGYLIETMQGQFKHISFGTELHRLSIKELQ